MQEALREGSGAHWSASTQGTMSACNTCASFTLLCFRALLQHHMRPCLTDASRTALLEIRQCGDCWEALHGLLRTGSYLQQGQQLGDVMLGRHSVNDTIKAVRNSLHRHHLKS